MDIFTTTFAIKFPGTFRDSRKVVYFFNHSIRQADSKVKIQQTTSTAKQESIPAPKHEQLRKTHKYHPDRVTSTNVWEKQRRHRIYVELESKKTPIHPMICLREGKHNLGRTAITSRGLVGFNCNHKIRECWSCLGSRNS